jgi:KaiC/GvpD/RAD55 family RecA-like ATPase
MSLFAPATRVKSKARIGLAGVSGGGKTLGALFLAYGLTGDWSKVAVIDTEHQRVRFYANRTDLGVGAFLYAPMEPPFSPERFIEYVKEAYSHVGEDGAIIIDSFSHEWNGEGGTLDIKEAVAKKIQGNRNDFTAWSVAGKQHDSIVNKILSVPCHTLVTMRSKMAYEMAKGERGKTVVRKLGLAPVQREGMEYELDIMLDISLEHIASASKDTTGLLTAVDAPFVGRITPELGATIAEWLNNGDTVYYCDSCGAVIKGDATHTAKQIVDGTLEMAGRKLCINCFKKWKKEFCGFRQNSSEQRRAKQEESCLNPQDSGPEPEPIPETEVEQ